MIVTMHLYGGEEITISDIRGDSLTACDMTLEIKNLRLTGAPQELAALAGAIDTAVAMAVAAPARWNELPGRQRRAGNDTVEASGPFTVHLPASLRHQLRRRRRDW
jgi:hypothetical protein